MQTFDLRTLPVLARLLTNCSVTRTAQEIGADPSAVSRTLTKARMHFGDDLLVRAGRQLQPTERGLRLAKELRGLVDQVESILQPDDPADLRSSERSISMRCDDVFAGFLAPRLIAAMQESAPKLRLRMVMEQVGDEEGLRNGTFDIVLGAGLTLPPEAICTTLGSEPLVGICRHSHPFWKGRVSNERLMTCDRVIAEIQEQHETGLARQLSRQGCSATVALVVPTLFSVARTVAECDYIGILPCILAKHLADKFQLCTFDLPIELAPVSAQLAWHPRDQNDLVHKWLRQRIAIETQAELKSSTERHS